MPRAWRTEMRDPRAARRAILARTPAPGITAKSVSNIGRKRPGLFMSDVVHVAASDVLFAARQVPVAELACGVDAGHEVLGAANRESLDHVHPPVLAGMGLHHASIFW
jgi:hypothetical protein